MTDPDRVRRPARRPHVVASGAGPTVFCLHGIGSSSKSFAPQLDPAHGLTDVARVVAWDAPGYGGSPDPDPETTLADLAATVAAVLVEEGAPAILFGMSWGGVVAMQVALDYPELVAALVLGGSTPGSGTDASRAADMRSRVPELAEIGSRAFAALRAPRLLRSDAPTEEVAATAALMAAAIRLPGYAVAAESMASADLRSHLHRIAVPTLVFHGRDDRVTGAAASQVLARGISGARLAVVPEAGHLANQENPMHVNRLVASFLTDALASRSSR